MKTTIDRIPDDPCLLCGVNKADKPGSHFTPAGIIKKVVGERDKEEIYSIDAAEHSISRFMGRANLKNEDPEIKKGGHVADYILCSSCEKKLGDIEGLCNQKLNLLVDDLAKGSLKVQRTKKHNKFIPLPGVDKNVLALYLYSVVWRQCLSQELGNGARMLLSHEQEQLRQIVSTGINMPLKEIKADNAYAGYPGLQLLTTYHNGETSANMFNPNDHRTNPYLFFVGPYSVLLHLGPAVSHDFSTKTGLPSTIVDRDLIINTAAIPPVAIVNETIWNGSVRGLMSRQAEIHNSRIYTELSQTAGIPYELAKQLILQETSRLLEKYPNDSSRCMNLALHNLLSKLN